VIAFLRIDQPGRCASNRLTLGVGPIERGAAPGLDIDSEVALVPGLQCRSVFGLEEDAADSRDSFHMTSDARWSREECIICGPNG
jgi:hypothetical protein